MKRDMELCRTLLLRIEDFDSPAGSVHFVTDDDPFFVVDGHSVDKAIYNFSLLRDAGFLDAPPDIQALDAFGIRGLSWAGHEFLDTIRGTEVWNATKEVAKKAGGVGFDLLVQIAKAEAKRFITTHTGLPL